MSKYPVNKSMCEHCSSCVRVTHTVTGHELSRGAEYYQCISDMEGECADAYNGPLLDDGEFIDETWTEEDQAEFDRIFPLGADEYVGY